MHGEQGVQFLDKAVVTSHPMVSSSNIPYYDHTDEYKQLGYVPFDKSSTSASITLENAYEDWTIYHTALLLGDKQIANTYKKRALSYQNVFKPSLGFACPRYKDGSWKENIDLLSTHGQGFIEGNAWNYSFYVPQAPSEKEHILIVYIHPCDHNTGCLNC